MTDGFCLYTCNHGQHLSSIKVASKGQMVAVPSLPCPNLQQLDLEGCSVTLAGASAGIVQTCTGLTYLRLQHCRVAGQQPSIALLATLTKLQHLELNLEGQVVALDIPSTLLCSLTKLTHLGFALDNKVATQAWLQQLSSLTHLQELSVSQYGSVCSPSTTPGLSRLTALTSLRLEGVSLDPSLLRDISTQLQSLALPYFEIEAPSDAPAGVQVAVFGSANAGVLLSCIADMPRLQHLFLDTFDPFDWPDQAAAYTALTASSNLQRLELDGHGWPDGIWQKMFITGRTWPHLQSLKGPCWEYEVAGGAESESDSDVLEQYSNMPAAFAQDDLSAIISCCQALQALSVCVHKRVSLAPLSSLSALVDLRVEGVTDASMQSLAALTQLTRLSVKLARGVRVQSVAKLTALRSLRQLQFDSTAVRLTEEWDVIKSGFSTTSGEAAPDVWRQLLERCAVDSRCSATAAQQLALAQQQERMLALQEQIISAQQQELATATAECGQLRACVQALEGQVQQQEDSAQQQQLAAATAECSQLRARVQALEGQVQRLQALRKGSRV